MKAKTVKKTDEIGKGKAGPGRPKGMPNKLTADLKAMILSALDKAGGVEYLTKQASESPAAFMTLVGKVLPLTVANPDGTNLPAPQFLIQPVATRGE